MLDIGTRKLRMCADAEAGRRYIVLFFAPNTGVVMASEEDANCQEGEYYRFWPDEDDMGRWTPVESLEF